MTDGSASGTIFSRSFDDPYLTNWPVFSAPFTRPHDIHSAATVDNRQHIHATLVDTLARRHMYRRHSHIVLVMLNINTN